MSWRNNINRYGSLSIGLHWLMFLLLIAVYVSIELHEIYPKGSALREALKTWHFMLGLSVFALVWLRLLGLMMGSLPRIDPDPPKWQKLSAKAVHLALYAFMIGMPLLGWLMLSAEGESIPLFGLHLPTLIGPDSGLAESIEEIHEAGGTAGYFLVGLHTIAALFHHYIVRDNTLVRMLPKRN